MTNQIYNPTYSTIINRSLRMVGAYNAGVKPRAEQVNDALETLCMMLKSWQVSSPSWLLAPFQLPLVAGQASYQLGSAGTAQYLPALATLIDRPTRVKNLRRKSASGTEVPLGPDGGPISRQEYMQLPNKTIQGTVVQAYYDPQLVNGVLYVWPAPSVGVTDVIVGDCDRPIQIPVKDGDTLDVPMELVDPITFCLAERLWWEYPGSAGDYQLIQQRALIGKEAVESYDREMAPTQYQPGR